MGGGWLPGGDGSGIGESDAVRGCTSWDPDDRVVSWNLRAKACEWASPPQRGCGRGGWGGTGRKALAFKASAALFILHIFIARPRSKRLLSDFQRAAAPVFYPLTLPIPHPPRPPPPLPPPGTTRPHHHTAQATMRWFPERRSAQPSAGSLAARFHNVV